MNLEPKRNQGMVINKNSNTTDFLLTDILYARWHQESGYFYPRQETTLLSQRVERYSRL